LATSLAQDMQVSVIPQTIQNLLKIIGIQTVPDLGRGPKWGKRSGWHVYGGGKQINKKIKAPKIEVKLPITLKLT